MNDLKPGTTITWKGQPHMVTFAQHVQMGRGGAIVRTKLKNILTGNVLEETFKSGDRVEEADLGRGKASFLYHEKDQCFFMDTQTFEQFLFSSEDLGLKQHFLKEGQEVDLLSYQGKPVSIQLPIKIELTVAQTGEASRGNTAQGSVMKEAVLETGYAIKVPLFIKQGDRIKIHTETGEYVERA